MTAQVFDFSVAIGKSVAISSAGTFVYYLAGSAGGVSEKINVKHAASGLSIDLLPGQSFQIPAGAKIGAAWQVTNAGGGTIKGTVVIGSGEFRDSRTVGEVSVVDGGRSRTAAGQAFIHTISAGGAAATYPQLALINPTGSGKDLFLTQAIFSAPVDTMVTGGVGSGYGNTLTISGGAGRSKKSGGAVSVGITKSDAGGGVGSTHLLAWMTAKNAFIYHPTEPFLISPGYGFLIGGSVVNTTLCAIFDVFELPQ